VLFYFQHTYLQAYACAPILKSFHDSPNKGYGQQAAEPIP